jgi:16S rRNA (cytidine1402-2'-O)-methyltransferase
MEKGKLYMIPITIGEIKEDSFQDTPPSSLKIVLNIKYFIVENIKSARRFLRQINKEFEIDNCEFYVLNKHTSPNELNEFLNPCRNGENVGVLSEAGCPGIADPGSSIANIAHRENIMVIPLIGPSSIFMALMSSGLNGQQFTFHGYLPKNREERVKKIKSLAIRSKDNGAQLFMETPFRNNHLLEDIINFCPDNLLLCIASNISTKNQFIKTKNIKSWKVNSPNLNKKPTIFIFGMI